MATLEELENHSNSRYEWIYSVDPRCHWAAIVIQRAYRSYRLRAKFRGLKSLQQYNTLDALILQAAGLSMEGTPRSTGRPALRRIRRERQEPPLRRSRSLKDPERRSFMETNRARDDSELCCFLPPPPALFTDPPHARGDSSPAVLQNMSEDEDDLPPPPPYVPPPESQSTEEDFPPPPPPFHPDDPLPPPPPSFPPLLHSSTQGLRHSCASTSSSISSVDSGLPKTPPPHSRTWISSPRLLASPEAIYEASPKKCVRILDAASAARPSPMNLRPPADDVVRKRQYRVGLNLFNMNPERGMEYLIRKNYVEYSPSAVAKFLLGRKGISKRMIGEYLSSLQRPFNMAVLHCFVHEVDFSGLHIDIALRLLQQEVMLPGESQKIEKIVEVFSKRYIQCNSLFVNSFSSPDTIFVLSYAMVLLNTDLHSRAVRSSRRMKKEDFVRNLRGVDAGHDLDGDMLRGIFDRIRSNAFSAGPDQQTQVAKVEENIRGEYERAVGGRLAQPHRRLVCFCRLTEVPDLGKNTKKDTQRGVFLFNDLLFVTKSLTKKKAQHQYRYSVSLRDLRVSTYSSGLYAHGIQVTDRFSGKALATFDAKSDSDQKRFVHDLQESISETIEMDRARLYFDDVDEEEML